MRSMKPMNWGFKKKSVIAIILVLVMIVAVLTSILVPLSKSKTAEGDVFTPMPAQTSETVEMLKDLPQDFTVDITSDKNINQQNLSEFVTVTNNSGTVINVGIEKRNGGYYTILPPANKYDKGEYYTIQLQNAKFKDERLSSQSSLLFATGKEDVTDIQIKTELNSVSEEKIIYVSDDTIELVKESDKIYNAGDVLLLPDPEDGLGEAAYKIEEVLADNGTVISLSVSKPSLDEVYGKVEIYGNQEPTLDDLKFYSKEEVEEELLKNESVRAIGFACAVLDGEEPYTQTASNMSRGWDFDYDVDIKPAFKLPDKVDLDIFNVKLNPLEFSVNFEIVWEIKKINAKVTLTADTIVNFEAFTNVDSDKNIYSSGTRTTLTQSVNLKVEISGSSPTFEKQQKKGMLKYFNEEERVKNPLNPKRGYDPAWAVQSLEANANGDKEYFDLLAGKKKHTISEASTINNFIRGKSSEKSNIGSYIKGTEEARKQVQQDLRDLVSCYEQGQHGMDSNLLPFVTMAIPLPYGCSIHVRIGFKIIVNFSAVFEGNAKIVCIDERVDVTTDDGTKTYENKTTEISISAIIKGKFEARFALAVDTKLTLAKIFYISLEVEGGVYFETEGYGGVLIGDYDEDNDIFSIEHDGGYEVGGAAYFFDDKIAFVGHFYCDFGGYVGVTLKSGLYIDLIIVKIDVSVSLKYENKWSIFDAGLEEPDFRYDLIFEDELKGKFKNEIASGQEFKDDLLFGDEFINFYGNNSDAAVVMDYDQYVAKAPKVLRRAINLKTREVTYEPIPYERLHFDFDEGTTIDVSGRITQKDSTNPVIDDLIWITAEDKGGNLYSIDEFAFLRITKDPVPVEAVNLSVASDEIYSDSETFIFAEIDPNYASYQDIQYEIVDFIHNGVSVEESEIAKYVYFDENYDKTRGKLITTDLVSIGDKVIIRGIAKHDNIASDALELTIVRRPVDSLSFVTQNRQTTVVVGQELPFDVFVYPLDATFNKEGSKPTVVVNNSDLAEIIEKDGKQILKVTSDISAFGKAVELTISADDNGNIVSFNYSMMVINVPIDTLKITNENLSEFAERTSVNQGQSINLVAKAEPNDATVLNKIQILKNVDNEYVTIDEKGVLRISKYAPIGYEFSVSARYDNINSKNYHFVVNKIATEKVHLYEQNGQSEVAPNNQLLLKTEIQPANATFFAPEYIISEGAEWVSVGYTGLLTIHEDAPIGAVIAIYAMVDGVMSNTVTFNVPAKNIAVTSPKDTLETGERMVFGYELSPTNNTLLPVTFRIVEGGEFASITQSGSLTVNKDVSVSDARIGIVADIGGVTSEVYYIDVKVPVTSIELYTNMSGGTAELGSSILLNTKINPEFATDTDVEFVVDRADIAQVNDGWLKITEDTDAIGEAVEIVAKADGVVSNVLRIRITKVAVLDVEFIEENLECKVNLGGTKILYASAVPGNATNNNVSYRIVSGMDLAAIEDNVLTVNQNAPLGSRIEIVASADGVDSKEHLIVIVTKIDVERVDIAIEGNMQCIAPSGTAKFHSAIYPLGATESIVTYSIVGEGRNYAYIDAVTGELTVNPVQLIVRGDIVIRVIATADGVSSKPIDLPIIVPITDITMPGGDITVECGSEVELSANTNSNATNKNIEYRFWNGTNLSESNQYGTIEDDTLFVNHNIFVPNAELSVVAIPKGAATADVMSNIRTVRVHIPVKTVSIMSNKTSIMLGESATLKASIFPAFASNQILEYRFVDNSGKVINAPWGVSLSEDVVSVKNDVTILSSTPRFMVCAFVDGVASNVWRFEAIERPVTELNFDEDKLQILFNQDRSAYEAHPNVDYEFIIKAAVNGDASFRGITFTALVGDKYISSVAAAENLKSDGLWYSVRLNVLKGAKVGEKIVILAQSQRNPQIRAEISIDITAIYADEIVGANISAVSNRGEKRNILDGEEFGGNLNGYSSNYINPGDTININKLYFDDELTNNYFKNVTFGDRFTLGFDHTKFITITEKGITVNKLEDILSYIKPGEDSFTVTVTLDQGNGQVLKKEFRFFIFVSVKTVQFVDGVDAKGGKFKMTDDQKLYVDRYKDSDSGNEFTFHFSINNGTYTTNRLLLVNSVELADIENERYQDQLEDKSGLGLLANKTAPQITFSTCDGYRNEIKIKFHKWYNVGTVFEVILLNPDHAAAREPLFRFTLHINPVNESNDFEFGMDGKFTANGVDVSDSSYQVKYYEGPVAIRGINEYADLRLDYAVELELGMQNTNYGQHWELVSCNNNDVTVISDNSSVSRFIIEATKNAKDSYVENQLVKLIFKYVDGSQHIENAVIYIRLVNLLQPNVPYQFIGDFDYNIRAEKTNLRDYIYYNDKDVKADATYIKPAFTVVQPNVAKIENGDTLVITDFNMNSVDVNFTAKQFYNGEEILIGEGEPKTLNRRFIANVFQLIDMKNMANDNNSEVTLIQDINLAFYIFSVSVESIDVNFNGNGHTISYVGYSMGDQKLNDSDVTYGLFGTINSNATVKNLILKNVNVTSGKQHKGKKSFIVGALAHTNKGTIENVQVYGNMDVERQGSVVGGIAAKNYGTIKNSTNHISFRGSGDIGGIVGQNYGTVKDCNNEGRIVIVYKQSRSMGGIVGYNTDAGTVLRCNQGGHIVSENTITGKFNVGAIIGHNSGTFDKEGFTGSHYVTYTRYDGFIFGWGAYDNGTYLFANYHYRVGKQD